MIRSMVLPIAVLGILASMIVPVPPVLMDYLIGANLIIALVLLISTLTTRDALALTSLPSLLLLATLYRLALNISTTRNILSQGDGGAIVKAFGDVVIGGNLVVGIVIFMIITLVQFIVIAKGSERVAEVSARFTLDALPGKQMSIDADVRAGMLDLAQAKQKRQELQTESRFFGALDGAMKFIKGDAIAGVVITVINILGGFSIGMLVEGMEISEALHHYTTLTIGDGLAAQIPALLNSLAAGIVVTRVTRGEDSTLSQDLVSQIGASRAVRVLIGVVSCGLAFVPQMPLVPFLSLGGFLVLSAMLQKPEELPGSSATPEFRPRPPAMLLVGVGASVAGVPGVSARLAERIQQVRSDLFERWGVILPVPESAVLQSPAQGYQLSLRGERCVALAELGENPEQQIAEALGQLAESRLVELVDDVQTRRLLDMMESYAGELVQSVIPTVVSVTQLTELLKVLLREGISIRNLDVILQAIAEHGPKSSNERVLMEEVRIALRSAVLAPLRSAAEEKIAAVAVEPVLDLALSQAEREKDLHKRAQLTATIAQSQLSLESERCFVTSRGARRMLREILNSLGIKGPVIAFEEIPEGFPLQIVRSLAPHDPVVVEQMIGGVA